MRLADSHNHLQQFDDPATIVAAMRAAGITGCVANATSEADWALVARLAEDFPGYVQPAFGIHPWHAHTATDGWPARLREWLARFPQAAIGECGLDRWIESPPLEIQFPVFETQLAIARELDRTASVHCVRAWGALHQSLDRSPPPARWLVHSFAGSRETAKQLVPTGAFFSLSGHSLHPHKASLIATCREIPRDRLLVETDAPDMRPPAHAVSHPLPDNRNHPANLAAITTALAPLLALTPDELATVTLRNHAACFATPR